MPHYTQLWILFLSSHSLLAEYSISLSGRPNIHLVMIMISVHRNSITGTQISSPRADNLTLIYSLQKSIPNNRAEHALPTIWKPGFDREQAEMGK